MNCSMPANANFHLIMQIRLTLNSARLLKAEFPRVGICLKPFWMVFRFFIQEFVRSCFGGLAGGEETLTDKSEN